MLRGILYEGRVVKMDAIFCGSESKSNVFLTPNPSKKDRKFLNVSTEKVRSKSDSNSPFTMNNCNNMSKFVTWNDENCTISHKKKLDHVSLFRSPLQPLNCNSEIMSSETKNIGRCGKESTFSTPQLPRGSKTHASSFHSANRRLDMSQARGAQKTELICHNIFKENKKFIIFDEFAMNLKEDSPKRLHSQPHTLNTKENSSDINVRVEIPAPLNMFEKGENDLTSSCSVKKTLNSSELFYGFDNFSETETIGSSFWNEDDIYLEVGSIGDIAASACTWNIIKQNEYHYCSPNTSFDSEPTETTDLTSQLSMEIQPESIDFPWNN